MKILQKSSEEEMILRFLQAEYSSDRFCSKLMEIMGEHSIDKKIILCADLGCPAENAVRKRIMGLYRGYGLNEELFENFPTEIDWNLCCFYKEDLGKIQYIDYSYWNELSEGTRLPAQAAETIRNGRKIYGQSNDGFLRAAEYIKNGGNFADMIFLTSDFCRFVIVEGHLRMTAYALAPEHFDSIRCLVGQCSAAELNTWAHWV